jgi:effector-binding domain-containing protein
MIDPPKIVRCEARAAAVIRLTIPRDAMQRAMGPAIQELMSALSAQGVAPAGPLYAHHLRLHPETWDFEIGVPVAKPITAAGRVEPGTLPACTVARSIYQGGYEGLGVAWTELGQWIEKEGHVPAENLWECYVAGPEASPDPKQWRTELNRPLTTVREGEKA